MKTNRIVPAALAIALFTAGGVTHAMAGENEHFHRGMETQLYQSAAPQESVPLNQPIKGLLTLSQAQQKALDKVGGGEIISTQRYGIGDEMYKFQIKTGSATKQVTVNGKTGTTEVAATMDPGLDPAVIGNPDRHHGEDRG